MPDFVSIALVDARGRVLLQERDEHAPIAPDRWCLPGGGAEPGESAYQAAVRELAEETGVRLPDGEPHLLSRFRFDNEFLPERSECTLFAAYADLRDADIVCGEGRQMVFVEPAAAFALPLIRAARLALLAVTGTDRYRAAYGDPGLPGAGHRRFAAVILVDPQGRVLLQERDEHAPIDPDCWGLCGGHLEPGEDPRAGAVRELAEETGVHLAPERLTWWGEFAVDHRHTGGGLEPMHVFAAATTVTDADIDCREGRRIVFVDPAAATALPLTAAAAATLGPFLDSAVYATMAR